MLTKMKHLGMMLLVAWNLYGLYWVGKGVYLVGKLVTPAMFWLTSFTGENFEKEVPWDSTNHTQIFYVWLGVFMACVLVVFAVLAIRKTAKWLWSIRW